MKINMKKEILTIGILVVSFTTCNKEIICDTCDNGHPVSNVFKNECKKPWTPTSDINPCNIYKAKIDSLQQEIMDIGWKNDSLVLKYEYGWEF